ncbi:hypothetical protein BBO99_00000900 [Phytophthora kernoviae]|uniref:Uncharacterized protein n=2 Tax=Phytophthora kernoviae TaxID=325452 RepID=A0A3R7HNB8_9STRA|nr:hypothetical protein G195_002443 [Phytophthora kernoviae 00238/432]KAG2531647.1 hypothetical protein JM16_000770 [Phytophthora kernoviae]KAG2532946.1 hypothetical protein JM18_000853 [Phytophthora kernoviae]RLN37694.1 hypothetical protein BBI17_000802 [Phytophthora kernoviae]RLN84967.1 hypothetical protein BBO99_00000900 [Phytophthora kernoviae]
MLEQVKEGMTTSALVVSDEYRIFARVQLDIKGKKRPRPARYLEFSDYETPNGIGPYDSQVSVIDLAILNSSFKGFYGGFTALSNVTFVNETYLVPAKDDPKYTETAWKVVVKAGYTPSATHSGFGDPGEFEQEAEYVYLVPFFNGTAYASKVVRVLAHTFCSATPVVEALDLSATDKSLKGFGSSFTHGSYGYLVPRENENGLFGKLVPDFADRALRGFSGGMVSGKYGFFVPYFNGMTFSGKVCRINLEKFEEVQTLDLTQLNSTLRGFADGILSKVEETLDVDLFNEFQVRIGTTDPYNYAY